MYYVKSVNKQIYLTQDLYCPDWPWTPELKWFAVSASCSWGSRLLNAWRILIFSVRLFIFSDLVWIKLFVKNSSLQILPNSPCLWSVYHCLWFASLKLSCLDRQTFPVAFGLSATFKEAFLQGIIEHVFIFCSYSLLFMFELLVFCCYSFA